MIPFAAPIGPDDQWPPVPGQRVQTLSLPIRLKDYFQGAPVPFQEYFRFPEMTTIRNPICQYFRIGPGSQAGTHWIDEGTLHLEEDEEGWLFLGAEHHELARVAVRKSGDPNYCPQRFDIAYVGPLLRGASVITWVPAYLVRTALDAAASSVPDAAALVHTPAPCVTPVTPAPCVTPVTAKLEGRFVEESVAIGDSTWYFQVWIPPNLEAVKAKHAGLPAILMLHGFKECGWDNEHQMKSGLGLRLTNDQEFAEKMPGIVVMPQLPRRPWDEALWKHWRDPEMQSMAVACLESAVVKYGADRSRLYCIGESLGTEGAWFLAADKPDLFAAVGGSTGSVTPYDWQNWSWAESSDELYKQLASGISFDTGMWFCHGSKDEFVPVEQSRRFYAALQEVRRQPVDGTTAAEVVYKEYEDLDHLVWDRAYDDGMIDWLLKHRQKS